MFIAACLYLARAVWVALCQRLLISGFIVAAIGGVSRVSAISVMFEGDKHRESSALTDDCVRIPDVLKDLRKKHERRKCGIECSSNTTSKVRI